MTPTISNSSREHWKSEKDVNHDIQPVPSVQEGRIRDEGDEKHGKLHRSFSPRQVHIISLGSNIGSGLFITTGKALATGGAVNMLLGYAVVCGTVVAVLQSLSEMTIAFPVSGNYIDYADRWVDPALAFGAGFAEWLGWTSLVASETAFLNMLFHFWPTAHIPLAGSITVFLVICLCIFLLPNQAFAWFEYVTSIIKLFTFLIILCVSLAIIGGVGSNESTHHNGAWKSSLFRNNFQGFAECALLSIWAIGDQVIIGIMGGEAKSPRYSMAHAIKLVPARVNFIFLTCVVFVTLLVYPKDDRLLGGSSSVSSPFIIAVQDAGIPLVPDILNAGMMCGVLGIGAESIYLASRILRTMARQNLIPECLAKVDSNGRPRYALFITTAVAVFLSYIQLASGGSTALNWLISITSASFFINWIIIALTNFRFNRALRLQNDYLYSQVYSWKSSFWPLMPTWLMLVSLLLLACCLACAIQPSGGQGFSISNFFEYTIGVFLIIVFTFGYKVIFRTPWRNLATADLTTGRHTLSTEEILLLDEYYSQPPWRRFFGYLKLW